jgi:hypothetical protein
MAHPELLLIFCSHPHLGRLASHGGDGAVWSPGGDVLGPRGGAASGRSSSKPTGPVVRANTSARSGSSSPGSTRGLYCGDLGGDARTKQHGGGDLGDLGDLGPARCSGRSGHAAAGLLQDAIDLASGKEGATEKFFRIFLWAVY